jgi:hypothetical protein
LLHADPVLEDLFPSFLEQPSAVAGTPSGLTNLLNVTILIILPHDRAELGELVDDLFDDFHGFFLERFLPSQVGTLVAFSRSQKDLPSA